MTEGASGPPEVACLPLGGDAPAAWTPVTDFNTGLAAGPPPSWEAVTWTSDEHQIEGLLVLPPGRAAERLPLVVLLHGGPTWGVDATSGPTPISPCCGPPPGTPC